MSSLSTTGIFHVPAAELPGGETVRVVAVAGSDADGWAAGGDEAAAGESVALGVGALPVGTAVPTSEGKIDADADELEPAGGWDAAEGWDAAGGDGLLEGVPGGAAASEFRVHVFVICTNSWPVMGVIRKSHFSVIGTPLL